MDYRILKDSPAALGDRVNELLSDGWKLYEGPQTDTFGHVIQAMTKGDYRSKPK